MLADTALERSLAADDIVSSAIRTLDLETQGIQTLRAALSSALRSSFISAVTTIHNARGRAIVTGMGKSGHIGRKIAATLASTGTPAFFVHPAEASHGDLGMITEDDVILALSWSGETAELRDILQHARRFRVPVIAFTSNVQSALSKNSNIALILPKSAEACPHGLAPTTSTTVQLALGDALAVALLERRGFTANDFRVFHPGGKLGAGLTYVRDLMHADEQMPLVHLGTTMADAILTMSAKSFGCVGVTDTWGKLVGIVTDGDLRRHMSPQLLSASVEAVMTRDPVSLKPETIASGALEVMTSSKITSVFVTRDNHPIGILHLHDLLRSGVK